LLYFVVLILALSFLGGAFFSSLERNMLCTAISIITGAAITVVLYLSPLLVYGDTWMIDVVIDQALGYVAPHLLFGSIFAVVGAMLGSFILSSALR
jgi:hypothetical protein